VIVVVVVGTALLGVPRHRAVFPPSTTPPQPHLRLWFSFFTPQCYILLILGSLCNSLSTGILNCSPCFCPPPLIPRPPPPRRTTTTRFVPHHRPASVHVEAHTSFRPTEKPSFFWFNLVCLLHVDQNDVVSGGGRSGLPPMYCGQNVRNVR